MSTDSEETLESTNGTKVYTKLISPMFGEDNALLTSAHIKYIESEIEHYSSRFMPTGAENSHNVKTFKKKIGKLASCTRHVKAQADRYFVDSPNPLYADYVKGSLTDDLIETYFKVITEDEGVTEVTNDEIIAACEKLPKYKFTSRRLVNAQIQSLFGDFQEVFDELAADQAIKDSVDLRKALCEAYISKVETAEINDVLGSKMTERGEFGPAVEDHPDRNQYYSDLGKFRNWFERTVIGWAKYHLFSTDATDTKPTKDRKRKRGSEKEADTAGEPTSKKRKIFINKDTNGAWLIPSDENLKKKPRCWGCGSFDHHVKVNRDKCPHYDHTLYLAFQQRWRKWKDAQTAKTAGTKVATASVPGIVEDEHLTKHLESLKDAKPGELLAKSTTEKNVAAMNALISGSIKSFTLPDGTVIRRLKTSVSGMILTE